MIRSSIYFFFFFFQAEDGIRDRNVTGVQTCALPISISAGDSVFQMEWIDACKGKSSGVTHGTSSKTHCDFDYSGSMIERSEERRVGKECRCGWAAYD